MSMILSDHWPRRTTLVAGATSWLSRVPRAVRAGAAAVLTLLAVYQFSQLMDSPAYAIRHALTAAADETRTLPWSRSPGEVEAVVARYFGGQTVKVDAKRFPAAVSVTLAQLDRDTCLEVRDVAGRIEGLVVVSLDGYRSAAECRDQNTMVWHILP